MDLNYLLSRHQISIMRAEAATCREARYAHRGLAKGYADRIRELQRGFDAGPMLPQMA